MTDIIPPRTENHKTYWPQTTIPYGEETAFEAAKVYAEIISINVDYAGMAHGTELEELHKGRNLIHRAAELMTDARVVVRMHPNSTWRVDRDQWLKDAGMEK